MPIVTGSGEGPRRIGRPSFDGSQPDPSTSPLDTPVDLNRIVGEVASGLGDTVTEPDFAGAANALALRLPRRLNAVFMDEARDGRGGRRDFFERVASRMLEERQSFMDGVTGSFGLSADDKDAVDRRSQQMTAALLRRAGRKAADMRRQAHADDLAAMGKEMQQDVLDGAVAVDLAASRFQTAAENARAFMDPDSAAKVGEEGERGLTRASLDRLIALDPETALTRIGNGTMDDLVRLKLLGAEDVADLKSKAEGAAARKAAKAAAAASVDGVLGSTVDVGLAEIREAQKTIAGDLRSALEADDDAAFDQAVRNAEALVRFHGSLTGETPEQTEAKVEGLREQLDALREQRDEGVIPVADRIQRNTPASAPTLRVPKERLDRLSEGITRRLGKDADLTAVVQAMLDAYQSAKTPEEQEAAVRKLRRQLREKIPTKQGVDGIERSLRRDLGRIAGELFEQRSLEGAADLILGSVFPDPDALAAIALEALTFVPVLGEVIEGARAARALSLMAEAAKRGDHVEARRRAREASEHLIAAVPVLGRGGKAAKLVPGLRRFQKKLVDFVSGRIIGKVKKASLKRFQNRLKKDEAFVAEFQEFRRENRNWKEALARLKREQTDVARRERMPLNKRYGDIFENFSYSAAARRQRLGPARTFRLRGTRRKPDWMVLDRKGRPLALVDAKGGKGKMPSNQRRLDDEIRKKVDRFGIKVETFTEDDLKRLLGDDFDF